MEMLLAPTGQPAAGAVEEVSELGYLQNFLHWSGTLRHPNAGPWSSRVHCLVHVFTIVAMLLFICSEVVLLWRDGATDLDELTLTLCVLNTTITFIFRLRHIAAWESEFQRLAPQERRDFGEFLSTDDIQLLRVRSRSMRRVVFTYLLSGVISSIVYVATPINADGLPLRLALPYDSSRPLAFAATWLYSAYIVFCIVIVTMAADSFNISLMVQLRDQLDLLNRNLRCLNDRTSRMKSSSLQTLSTTDVEHTDDLIHDVHYRLRKSIIHHQAIIRNVALLEQCLGRMLLGQSLSLGTSFCLQLFQAAKRAKGVQEVGKAGSYLMLVFSVLFMYCWFGDDLISESEKVALSAYDAVPSLEECPTSTKRSLLILMHRAQQPLRVTAGGFFSLSRESLVSVLNVSYSFFTILRNFKDD
ncbi:odorant receptor Or2-like [Schistocerca gregaria]|uniref:odorant receptor Or2-like n=1 Tax=Schistocerca gregaria TaxID=7010 RepID=UPI00211ECA9F|nr:odorant receptor Or2-like [Schistocerca gregaria]